MGGPGPAIRLERLVQRAEGVQQVALAVGIEQGPSLVLAVDVDHLLAQVLKSRDRHGHPVDLGGAAALRGDSSRDDQRVLVEHPAEDCFELSAQRLVLDFEDCRSPGLRLARADQVGRGLPSKNQPERREQQALPRPGLPRPGAEPPLQLDLHVLDQCKVLYRKLSQHDERASERLSEPFRSRAQCPVTNRFVPFILRFLGQPADQLIIIAARPSMGKTALALNICEFATLSQNVPVLMVSLEMADLEVTERLLWSRSRVDSHKLRKGYGLDHRELSKLGKAYVELEKAAFFIDSTPARNMLQITASARRLKLRKGLGLIVVDYIQLVDAEESRDSRQEQIARISRRLKTLARELHVPVIALSQLNRAVESREDRRPRMADLRESGAIEQDADIVLLLHRPDYYDVNDQPGLAEVIVAKNRNGPTGSVKLTFLKNLTRFENLSTLAEPPIDEGSPY